MTTRRRGWRAWLAAAVSAGLAGSGTLVPGSSSVSPAPGPGPAGGRPVAAQPPFPSRQLPLAAVVARVPAEVSAVTAAAGRARRNGNRGLGADATGGQTQLPEPGNGSANAGPHAGTAGDRDPGMFLPGWRAALESRWRERLATVTELSLAYHDAAERPPGGHSASHPAAARQLRRLMRETVAARRAMSDTEEALARLSAGRFGRCEQCAAAISVAQLARVPETRYCERCAQPRPGAGNLGALVVTAS